MFSTEEVARRQGRQRFVVGYAEKRGEGNSKNGKLSVFKRFCHFSEFF
jgi:hypothetical protein